MKAQAELYSPKDRKVLNTLRSRRMEVSILGANGQELI